MKQLAEPASQTGEAEGHVGISGEQFVIVGSQHLFCIGEGDIATRGVIVDVGENPLICATAPLIAQKTI